MSFRTDLLPVADDVRSLRGPDGFDIQTISITIIRRTWSGSRRGAGTPTDVVLTELPQQYKTRLISEKQIASSGGRFEQGDIRVGPITPDFGSGGVTPAELKPAGATGVDIIYVLAGSANGEYTVISSETVRAFSYFLVLRRVSVP